MANRSANERDMIQQDTEAETQTDTKASHGNPRQQEDTKMDFNLEDDIDSIEER